MRCRDEIGDSEFRDVLKLVLFHKLDRREAYPVDRFKNLISGGF